MLVFTDHAKKRAGQRGTALSLVAHVLEVQRCIHRQGYRFYYLTEKDLRYHPPALQDRLRNLVVVMDAWKDVVVTLYKNRQALTRIKKKPKRLIRNRYHQMNKAKVE